MSDFLVILDITNRQQQHMLEVCTVTAYSFGFPIVSWSWISCVNRIAKGVLNHLASQ